MALLQPLQSYQVLNRQGSKLMHLPTKKDDQLGLDTIVRLTFVNGLPVTISTNLQQATGINTMSMSDTISRARILSSKISDPDIPAVNIQINQASFF